MKQIPFDGTIGTEAELRAILGEPGELVVRKQLSALDDHCRSFIARSPYVLIGTTDSDGRCDVSPRGDAPGFVRVLDDNRLAIPERPGNRRADTLVNILQTGSAGLLFLIPGKEEILRANGRAWVVRDEALLRQMSARDKVPVLAIGLEVRECFFHCAKSIKRSKLWDHATWEGGADLASLAQVLMDQTGPADMTVEELEKVFQESYEKRLY